MGVRWVSDTYLTPPPHDTAPHDTPRLRRPLTAAFAETIVTAQAGILIASGRPVITSRSRRRQ